MKRTRIAEGLEDACWEGYEAVGMKEQDGKQVPNCVPTKTAAHRLDGVRGHQLLPSTLARKLPAIYSQENVPDPLVQVKLFSPYTGAVWYLTEYDPGSNEAFGWADLGYGMGELGYISVSELEGLNRNGLPLVERDTSWRPVPLSQAKKGRMASTARVAQRHTNASTGRVAYEPPFHNAAQADEALGAAYRALIDLKLGFDSWHEIPSSAHPLYQQIMKAVDAVVTARQATTQVRAMVARKKY